MSVVCIDDVDEILGDERWEEALFHLMNAVRDGGTKIILSGERQALALAVKLPDLKSRIVAAATVEITDLNDNEKLQVLTKRAHNRGFRLGEDVGRFILSRSRRDMKQLLELLEILETETLLQGKTVTSPFVKKTLGL
jgi:DnaA family protein